MLYTNTPARSRGYYGIAIMIKFEDSGAFKRQFNNVLILVQKVGI